jgi:hypothetical protein
MLIPVIRFIVTPLNKKFGFEPRQGPNATGVPQRISAPPKNIVYRRDRTSIKRTKQRKSPSKYAYLAGRRHYCTKESTASITAYRTATATTYQGQYQFRGALRIQSDDTCREIISRADALARVAHPQ